MIFIRIAKTFRMRYDMPIDGENSALQEIGNALGSEYDQFRPFFPQVQEYLPILSV